MGIYGRRNAGSAALQGMPEPIILYDGLNGTGVGISEPASGLIKNPGYPGAYLYAQARSTTARTWNMVFWEVGPFSEQDEAAYLNGGAQTLGNDLFQYEDGTSKSWGESSITADAMITAAWGTASTSANHPNTVDFRYKCPPWVAWYIDITAGTGVEIGLAIQFVPWLN